MSALADARSSRRITIRVVEELPLGHLVWDSVVKGFGVRRQHGEARAYVLKYRLGRRQRFLTIGRHGSPWTPDTARREATRLLGAIVAGADPAGIKQEARVAETVAALCDRYLEEHARPHKKASSVKPDERNIRNHVLPLLGALRVRDVTPADIERFKHAVAAGRTARREKLGKHALSDVTGGEGVANRCLALLGKMFALAIRWGLRSDNPVRGIEKFREAGRKRFLSPDELSRFSAVLAAAERDGSESAYVVAAIRMLVLTGARLSEILTLRWEHVDLPARVLRLPDSKTGAKTVYLGASAVQVLSVLPRIEGNPFVFCGEKQRAPIVNLHKPWRRLMATAGIADARPHDLRHTFASWGVQGGMTLHMVGALLGHTQPQTTARYGHLADDPMKAAAETVSGRIAAAMEKREAVVVPMQRRG